MDVNLRKFDGNIEKNAQTKVPRILMVLSSVNIDGGVQNKVMDLYRNVDRSRVQFDFLVLSTSNESFQSEIESLGGNVYFFGRMREIGPISFVSKFYRLLKIKRYHGVHSYLGVNDGVILSLAKLSGLKIRISHSRGAQIDKNYKRFLLPLLKGLVLTTSTNLLACSQKAGAFLYGKASYEVVPNGIDIERFLRSDLEEITNIRKEIGIEDDTLVLGHVGRFSVEKNHEFLLHIAKTLVEKGIKFKMVLVGDGPLKDDIEIQAYNLKIAEYVYFAGGQTNVEIYYQIFDILLFPSFHEGFGNVAVEAQAAKKRVIASCGVSSEVDIGLGLIDFLSLDDVSSWIISILNNKNEMCRISRDDIRMALQSKGFSIESIIQEYYRIYGV